MIQYGIMWKIIWQKEYQKKLSGNWLDSSIRHIRLYSAQREHCRLSNLKGVIRYDEQIFSRGTDNRERSFFLCYMIERVARKLHQKNKYIVNSIPKAEWERLISIANGLHCENP